MKQTSLQQNAENQCRSNFAHCVNFEHCAKIRAARKFTHCVKFRASLVAACTEGSPYETKRNSEVQVKKMFFLFILFYLFKKKSFENVFIFILSYLFLLIFVKKNVFYFILFYLYKKNKKKTNCSTKICALCENLRIARKFTRRKNSRTARKFAHVQNFRACANFLCCLASHFVSPITFSSEFWVILVSLESLESVESKYIQK